MATELDSNLDANAFLSDLDKGLRSLSMGEECESIVRFHWLFAKYPFPILINSACLKLAEVFRNGSNFSRLLILRVFQQTEKHLEKILNLDEFIKRITTVSYSNDPIARGITLRVLGSIACVASQRKNIHHTIRNSLDSVDEIEVQASIEAAALFAKKSPDFALAIYPKILSILNNTPNMSIESKIALLSVLHHENYNSEVSKDVRRRCLSYLEKNETDQFLSAVLSTLTYISITSLNDIPEQVDLLLSFLKKNQSFKLKFSIIKQLQKLSLSTSHFLSKKNLEDFINIIKNPKSDFLKKSNLVCGVLVILEQLIKSPCLLSDYLSYLKTFCEETKEFCLKMIKNFEIDPLCRSQLEIISCCFSLMTELSSKFPHIEEESVLFIIDFLNYNVSSFCNEILIENERSFKIIFRSIVKIANNSKNASQKLIKTLCLTLNTNKICNKLFSFVCETICAIQNKDSNIEEIKLCIKNLRNNYKNFDDKSLCILYTLFFQLTSPLDHSQNAFELFENLNIDSAWFYFKIMRQAMRYGHHKISYTLCEKLQYCPSNENTYFWFTSLLKISEAENYLINSSNDIHKETKITKAISLLSEAMSHLKASNFEGHLQIFSYEFIKLRSKFLQNHLMLNKFCKMIRTSPAASIANLIALNSRDDTLKCGSIVNQMRENCKEFRKLAKDYSELYHNSFNADQSTLTYLQLQQHCCTIMAEAIESIFQVNRINTLFTGLENNDWSLDVVLPEHNELKNTCSEVSQYIRNELSTQPCMMGNRNSENSLSNQIKSLEKISEKLYQIPIILPRYFFQPLQNTIIKLALSPQPKKEILQSSLVIYSNMHFALKVEGVITNDDFNLDDDFTSVNLGSMNKIEKKKKIIRQVSKILLQVTSTEVQKKNNTSNFEMNKKNEIQKLQSIVVPHNDYFQEQFLLNLKSGIYSLHVEAFVIDENEAQWKTGSQSSIKVKVLEEV